MDDRTYSTGRALGVLLAAGGLALQWACLHAATFPASVFPVPPEATAGSWPANTLVTFVLFSAIYLASRRSPDARALVLGSRPAVAAAGACLLAGHALFAAAALAWPRPALLAAASAVMACGTTPLIVMWGEEFRFLDPKDEQLLVTLGGIVCSIGLYLVMTLVPAPLAAALFVAAPPASLACLLRARPLLEAAPLEPRARRARVKSPALLYVCIAAFSIPCNYLRDSADVQLAVNDGAAWAQILAVIAVVLLAVSLSEAAAERRGLLLVPSAVLFLLLAAMVVHLLPQGQGGAATPYLLYSGYYLFVAMIYLAMGPVAAMSGASPARLFAGAMMANVGGLIMGSALALAGSRLGEPAATSIVLAVTAVILVAGLALFSSRSYSIFRINYFDEDECSFEFLAPEARGAVQAGTPGGIGEAIASCCEAAAERFGLSARERDVLSELARGRTIATIAGQLRVSENTVKAHTKAIYRKLGVHTREELLARVEEQG